MQTPGLIFVACSLIIVAVICILLRKSKDIQDWPVVPGVVVFSRIEEKVDQDLEKMYLARVVYDYSVNGVMHKSDRITAWRGYGPLAREQLAIDKYTNGSDVNVYYDPKMPGRAVLEPGMSERVCQIYYGVLVFCGLLFIVGLILAASWAVHIFFVSAISIFAVAGYGFWFKDWAAKYFERISQNPRTAWAASKDVDTLDRYAKIITLAGLLLLIMGYALVLR
ncbi:MAG: DUF3592 domain-containing protein [Chloroflexi bacterium]|jgi:hypothetical protein|nr:DUF3592 domain-containing protein [Chloroflexota bacterium]MBT7080790.1 DUF3592 domain-containing protein [Chloroflexota bacterium]